MMTTDNENIDKKLETEMYTLIEQLYPICRSITGEGVRETLKIIKEHIPIEIHEVPTGTKVFDWTVPKEWNIQDAYVKDKNGKRVIDFRKTNLHVLGYSIPINKKMSLTELKEHLHSMPNQPKWIPYLTSYYNENWGFCLAHEEYEKLEEDTYEVVIDSTLENGYLTYGELYVKGQSEKEVLFSCYVCHPSMCNDNLSGVALIVFLAKSIMAMPKPRYSYRFLFIPETIGSITWLALNEKKIGNIEYGLVATCIGNDSSFNYKKSRKGNTKTDQIVEKVLIDSKEEYSILDFYPIGSDERQFCSPGFDLPIGCLMRTTPLNFPEYHTSADNLEFISPAHLVSSLKAYLNFASIIENNYTYLNMNPKCEPQLGKRGLYNKIGSRKDSAPIQLAFLWILSLSDGNKSLLDISMRSKIDFQTIKQAADLLEKTRLIKKLD